MKKTIVFSALALVISTNAFAQSPLADAARREAARREALKGTVSQTLTNEDLAKLPPRMAPARPAPTVVTDIGPGGDSVKPGAPAAATAPAAGAAAPDAPRDEKYWRDRMTAARSNLSRAEMFAESLQSRINALSADLVNRDDPAQRQKLAEDRQRALDELARVKTEIVTFTEAIRDIENEARRMGVPAGWLR
jgi:hypothetical protein